VSELIDAEREWREKVERGSYVEINNRTSAELLAEYDRLQARVAELERTLSNQHVFSSKGRVRVRYPRLPNYCDDLDCLDCHRHEDVSYRCTECPDPVIVPGKYVWHWQGKGHFHEPDDEDALQNHISSHGDQAYMMPWKAAPAAAGDS
jgi:hypothetical protein